jgi:two-component system response regulator HydG
LTGGKKKKDMSLTSLAAAREGFEKEYIVSVLERVEGSRTTASRILGLSRKALWEKCKRYGIPSAHSENQEDED